MTNEIIRTLLLCALSIISYKAGVWVGENNKKL